MYVLYTETYTGGLRKMVVFYLHKYSEISILNFKKSRNCFVLDDILPFIKIYLLILNKVDDFKNDRFS